MALPIGNPMPLLEGSTEWINGSINTAELLGRPTIVHFWAVSCPICKMNLPRLQELTQSFRDHKLELISIHMPRMADDQDVPKVKQVAKEIGLTGPCAIDNDHVIGNRFETGGVWPCYFLFDAEGKLRSRAAGALGLKMAENSLKRMLGTEEPALIGAAQ